jgi:drug/metabolite transporter (DMT)-like permease
MNRPIAVRLERIPPVGAAALGAFAIAFSAILVRVSEVSPATAATFRCLYAVPVLWLLARSERAAGVTRTPRERRMALIAGVLLGLELVVWHQSIADVGAGLATVVANLQVVFVALVAWAVLGERPSGRVLVALPIVVLGALLISGVLEEGAYGEDPGLGAALAVLAAVMYGAFLLLYRRTGREGALAGPLLDVSLAAAGAAALAGAVTGQLDLFLGWEAEAWLVLLALTSQVIGFGLIGSALPRVPAALGAIMLLLQPVAAVVLSIVLLGETPSALQLAGVAVILAGVLIAARSPRPPEAVPTPAPP